MTPPHNLRDLVASRIRDGAIGARQGFVRFVRFGESAGAIRRRRAPKPGGEGLKVRCMAEMLLAAQSMSSVKSLKENWAVTLTWKRVMMDI